MKETQRIEKLFNDLYNGNPWLDVNILDTLKQINHTQASQKLFADCNSIWEIVNHLIDWRLNVLQRVQGEILVSPAHNYFYPIPNLSAAAWQAIIERLADSQQKWITFLNNFNEADFEKIYSANDINYYNHIHGIIQHDAYHLGQIKLLERFIKSKLKSNNLVH